VVLIATGLKIVIIKTFLARFAKEPFIKVFHGCFCEHFSDKVALQMRTSKLLLQKYFGFSKTLKFEAVRTVWQSSEEVSFLFARMSFTNGLLGIHYFYTRVRAMVICLRHTHSVRFYGSGFELQTSCDSTRTTYIAILLFHTLD